MAGTEAVAEKAVVAMALQVVVALGVVRQGQRRQRCRARISCVVNRLLASAKCT